MTQGPQRPDWANETTLRERYWDDGDSLGDLADEYGTYKSHVRYWMERFDIPRRSPGRPRKPTEADGGER